MSTDKNSPVQGKAHKADDNVQSDSGYAVNRFEVIDETGRAYVRGAIYGSPVKVELSYQDDGRTLKVFVTERTEHIKEEK